MDKLIDRYQRRIEYLRISVTDRCNLRCVYCMPAEGIKNLAHRDILTFEEILRVVQAAVELGVSKVRVTGGEPLVRKGIVSFVKDLAGVRGIEDIAMTTNAILLERYAGELKAAGLHRVNISLDTLDGEKFRGITRGGDISAVWRGIDAAIAAGLHPIKLNCVVMRGVNDGEVNDFVRLTRERDVHVRFIEFMPIGSEPGLWESRFVSIAELKRKIEARQPLLPATVTGSGPADVYRVAEAKGTVGFISPVSEHFCGECNRLRLTADGKLRPCLLSDEEIDIREWLRSDSPEIKDLLLAAAGRKGEHHHLADAAVAEAFRRRMAQIGG